MQRHTQSHARLLLTVSPVITRLVDCVVFQSLGSLPSVCVLSRLMLFVPLWCRRCSKKRRQVSRPESKRKYGFPESSSTHKKGKTANKAPVPPFWKPHQLTAAWGHDRAKRHHRLMRGHVRCRRTKHVLYRQ